ncbi:UvrD-helicase domain-containing protein [Nocardioides dubius]|uniref:DNA 3'-5' helicase n=2 Tax=Nocardioides dubius TaxID=317019 RepID=A0ABP4E2T7_9ACTN
MTDPQDQAARELITTGTARTLFVNAGAGSGKTTALVRRVARLVIDDGVAMEQIAAVTFTEKAGAELRDRLRARFEKLAREETDPIRAARARAALDELDAAAIGTLHAFAQRILMAHPIEAGLPTAIEVLDEVASSIAFDDRWSRIQRDLLDDDAIATPLLTAMRLGVDLKRIRSLVRRLGSDWDLLPRKVLVYQPPPLTVPDMAQVAAAHIAVLDIAASCLNTSDKLYPCVLDAADFLGALAKAGTVDEALDVLEGWSGGGPAEKGFKGGRYGTTAAWPRPAKEIRDEIKGLLAAADAVRRGVVDQCSRQITFWAARHVLTAATHRRQEGRLEFHDLLVLTRDLLARSPHAADVRDALHTTYERLLLDEFQDTDPIQIELAVRIAAGRDADAEDWEDVVVPEGRLFLVGDAKQSIYRFRRASIETYLGAEERLGERVTLDANFRTIPEVVSWVNAVFGTLIVKTGLSQPEYQPLVAHRPAASIMTGPAVTVLGADGHVDKPKAAEMRHREAADVAGLIQEALHGEDPWTVWDDAAGVWRRATPRDIAILIPARTSMPLLEDALDTAGVHYRAESMSLVYAADDVRDLLMVARAIGDPSDGLALVAALRSPLLGCGDDDLWEWRHAGARLNIFAKAPTDALGEEPVGRGIAWLRTMHQAARWMTPSEVLTRIANDRRVFEIAAKQQRSRDAWRRLRFVIDQARAWTEVSHGGLRGYLAWVAHQATDNSRVSEAILPELDVDAVRVMTVHAAKGLEFPIVILSGMSSAPNTKKGVSVLWTRDGYEVAFGGRGLQSLDYEAEQAIDEQMGDDEKLRLLYVATTRARDHLVVSLHRDIESNTVTAATLIAGAGGATAAGAVSFTADADVAAQSVPPEVVTAPLPWDEWRARAEGAIAASKVPAAQTASGLEGTEPEVALAQDEALQGIAKGLRDLGLPPWSKGRYGSAVGRAVHGVLQVVDLATGDGVDGAVHAQAIAEGVTDQEDVVRALVRSALAADVVRTAAAHQHWREMYVGTELPDGTLLEGIIDLVYRDTDGTLVVVDYKTDSVTSDGLAERVAYYAPQLAAYRQCLEAATSADVRTELLFLRPGVPGTSVPVS